QKPDESVKAPGLLKKSSDEAEKVKPVSRTESSTESGRPNPKPSFRELISVDGISIGTPDVRDDSEVEVPAFLADAEITRSVYGPWKLAAVLAAIFLVLAVISVPWGWYARTKAAKLGRDENAANSARNSKDATVRPNYASVSWYVGATDSQRAKDEHWSSSA